MYKEEIERRINVMQACLDGKSIEMRTIDTNIWIKCNCPTFDWGTLDYRVREEPKSTPFPNGKEFYKAYMARKASWIKATDSDVLLNPLKVCEDGIYVSSGYITFYDLAAHYVWACDLTPCGGV